MLIKRDCPSLSAWIEEKIKVVHYAPLMIDQFNKKYFLQLDVWSGDLSSTRMVNHFIENIFLSWMFGTVI